ncbi:MAG: hypothetical protein CMM02_06315 [Rhodopirellula sp.]|nr:hypothetical protein [Rhodopirellula sp.]|tara:strand:- start:558 stop:1385 length:828 start_codon:yes stop_codon:yes gene_type:complete
MIFPIKLNKDFFKYIPTNNFPCVYNPSKILDEGCNRLHYIRAVSNLKFSGVFKTTTSNRFLKTIIKLSERLVNIDDSVILEVGASIGTTTLDIQSQLKYKRYFATDLNISLFYKIIGKWVFFFDKNNNLILVTNDFFIFYVNDLKCGIIKKYLLKKIPNHIELESTQLIDPDLVKLNSNKIVFTEYDIFTAWNRDKVDIVIAANILNLAYFTVSQISLACSNLAKALHDDGMLIVVDNRDVEKSTIFKWNGINYEILNRINGGTEIESIILEIII